MARAARGASIRVTVHADRWLDSPARQAADQPARYLTGLQSVLLPAAGGRMIVTMNGHDLAAGEVAARELLHRLGDCSREIDRLAAIVRAAPRDAAAQGVGQGVRDCTAEAARIRVHLRAWDVAAPAWIEHLRARVDRLTRDLGTLAEVNLATIRMQLPSLRAEKTTPSGPRDEVERGVRAYLYPSPPAVTVLP
jgi:hypothetical protein